MITKFAADDNGHAVVLVDEEYGYRYHVWHTGMTPAGLEAYWSNIPSISEHYLNPTQSMPGKWETAESAEDEQAWREAYRAGGFYKALIHWEDDSCLVAPDGRRITHAGYRTI